MTTSELKNLAQQLKCPEGEEGLRIAQIMNQSNKKMISNTIESLMLKRQDKILEIGHGNAEHLQEIFDIVNDIDYTGLEISKTMNLEAKYINQNFYAKNKADFHLYDGKNLPYDDETFDKIFTIETIYFWENIESFLSEIYRVLKPSGIFVLTFVNKCSMKFLPFVDYGFNIYYTDDVLLMAANAGFDKAILQKKEEKIQHQTGKIMKRKYNLIHFQK